MNIAVRPALPGDLAALMQCIRAHAAFERAPCPDATAAALHAALSGDGAAPAPLLAWVAVGEAATIAGYLTATRDFSTWRCAPFLHMDCLYVDERHRRSGVGSALFDALRSHADGAGIDEIQWQTPDWNHEAARFYRRLGATAVAKLRFTCRLPAPHLSAASAGQ